LVGPIWHDRSSKSPLKYYDDSLSEGYLKSKIKPFSYIATIISYEAVDFLCINFSKPGYENANG